MSSVIQCAVCSKSVSTTLSTCPHCGKRPYKNNCAICKSILRESDGEILKERVFEHDRYRPAVVAHKECIKKLRDLISAKREICNACKGEMTIQDMSMRDSHYWEQDGSCPHCGEIYKRYRCYICNLWLIPDFVHSEVLAYYPGLEGDTPKFIHNECVMPARNVKLEIRKVRRNCFIASAVCGENSYEVINLRIFRDHCLSKNRYGKLIIDFYTRTSPPISRYLLRHSVLSCITRYMFVKPLAWCVDKARKRID